MNKTLKRTCPNYLYQAPVLLLQFFLFLTDVNSNAVNAKYSAARLADPTNLLLLEETCKDPEFKQSNDISAIADKIVEDYQSAINLEPYSKEEVKFDKVDSDLRKRASLAALKNIMTDHVCKRGTSYSALQQDTLKKATDKFYTAIIENNFKRGCYNIKTGSYSNVLSPNVVCLSESNERRNTDVLCISDKEVQKMIKNLESDTKGIIGALCFRNGNFSGLMKFVLSEWLSKKSPKEKEEVIAKFHLLEEGPKSDTEQDINNDAEDNQTPTFDLKTSLTYLNFMKLPYIIMSNSSYSALAALVLFLTRHGHSYFFSPWNLTYYACGFYGLLALDKFLNYSIFNQNSGGLFGKIIDYVLNRLSNTSDNISDSNAEDDSHNIEEISKEDQVNEIEQDQDEDDITEESSTMVDESTQTEAPALIKVLDDDALSTSSCDIVELDEPEGLLRNFKDFLVKIPSKFNVLLYSIKDGFLGTLNSAYNKVTNRYKSGNALGAKVQNSSYITSKANINTEKWLISKCKEILSKLLQQKAVERDEKSAESDKIPPEDIKNITGMVQLINENPSIRNDLSTYFDKMLVQYEKYSEEMKPESKLVAAIDLIFSNPAGAAGRCAIELNEIGVESPSWKLSLISRAAHAIKSGLSSMTPWHDKVLDVANKPIVQFLAWPATIFRMLRNSFLAWTEPKQEIRQNRPGAAPAEQSGWLNTIKTFTRSLVYFAATPASIGYALFNNQSVSTAQMLGAGVRNVFASGLIFWLFSGLNYLIGDSFNRGVPNFYTIKDKKNLNSLARTWLYVNEAAYWLVQAVKFAPKAINTLGYASIAYWGYTHIPFVMLGSAFSYTLQLACFLLGANALDRVSGLLEKMNFRESPTAGRIDEYCLDVDRMIQDIERIEEYNNDKLVRTAS